MSYIYIFPIYIYICPIYIYMSYIYIYIYVHLCVCTYFGRAMLMYNSGMCTKKTSNQTIEFDQNHLHFITPRLAALLLEKIAGWLMHLFSEHGVGYGQKKTRNHSALIKVDSETLEFHRPITWHITWHKLHTARATVPWAFCATGVSRQSFRHFFNQTSPLVQLIDAWASKFTWAQLRSSATHSRCLPARCQEKTMAGGNFSGFHGAFWQNHPFFVHFPARRDETIGYISHGAPSVSRTRRATVP